jgi:anti-sigma regulatory factor (Ser/Thr protein kinase)
MSKKLSPIRDQRPVSLQSWEIVMPCESTTSGAGHLVEVGIAEADADLPARHEQAARRGEGTPDEIAGLGLVGGFWSLPATKAAVATARHRAVATLRLCGVYLDSEAVGDIELLVSELVTNAVRYGGGSLLTVGVRASAEKRSVVVTVVDRNPAQPVVRTARADEESGRGMFLVEQLTHGQWGSAPTRHGKQLWGRLPLPEQPRADRNVPVLRRLIRAARPQP